MANTSPTLNPKTELEIKLSGLIEKEKDVVPFLLDLEKKERRSLVPIIKKLYAYYHFQELKRVKENGYRHTSWIFVRTKRQRKLSTQSAFICCNLKEYSKLGWGMARNIIEYEIDKEVLPHFVPTWFGQLMNGEGAWLLSYEKAMIWMKKGYFEPAPELLAELLRRFIISNDRHPKQHRIRLNYLLLWKYPETLESHIWYLFEHECNLHWLDNHLRDVKGEEEMLQGLEEPTWKAVFKSLIKAGEIDRMRVLRSSLQASNKGFDKANSGWYMDLFAYLEPTEEEQLHLQDDLFSSLNSPHSKVINEGLKLIKKLAVAPAFHGDQFVEQSPVLLVSEVKSVVKSTLMILEKLGRKQQQLQAAICLAATEAYIHQDENIQLRVSKIIKKYGKEVEGLEDKLIEYSDMLMHEPRKLVQEFLPEDEHLEEEVFEPEPIELLSEEMRMPQYESLEDLIFFVSQVQDHNEIYHLEQLLSLLPKLHLLIHADNVSRLEPTLIRSLKRIPRVLNNEVWSFGPETYLLNYFYQYADLLEKKYPSQLSSYSQARKAIDKELSSYGHSRGFIRMVRTSLKDQSIKEPVHYPFRRLFQKSLSLVEAGQQLELLSLPTHLPCWIDPHVLIERVLAYEKAKVNLDFYDLQIAFQRLPKDFDASSLKPAIDSIGQKEVRQMLLYFYNFSSLPRNYKDKWDLWIPIIISKGELERLKTEVPRQYEEQLSHWDWKIEERSHSFGLRDQHAYSWLELKLSSPKDVKSLFKPILSKAWEFLGQKVDGQRHLYHFIHNKESRNYYPTANARDSRRLLSLMPNFPEFALKYTIQVSMIRFKDLGQIQKRNIVEVLTGLNDIWSRPDYGPLTYLFLAEAFVQEEAVARELATEVWIKATSSAVMNQQKLGETLGRLQQAGFGPLKRFTDNLNSRMLHLSSFHNRQLLEFLDAMIPHLPDQAIRNTKKLLEPYYELRQKEGIKELDENVATKLKAWQGVSSLKSLTKKLLT